MPPDAHPTSTSEGARRRLRDEHQMRLVTLPEEGTAAADLPRGVYGFTASPGLAAPLFRERRYRNFEVHHRLNGSIVIVGFLTPHQAEHLARAIEPIEVELAPDQDAEASEIVSISYARLIHHLQYSVLNQPAIRLSVGPELEPA